MTGFLLASISVVLMGTRCMSQKTTDCLSHVNTASTQTTYFSGKFLHNTTKTSITEHDIIQAIDTKTNALGLGAFFSIYLFYLGLTAFIGVPGNILVVVTLLKTGLKNGLDLYMFTLALLDLIVLIFGVPMNFIMETPLWRYLGNDFICRGLFFTVQATCVFSTFVISLVAIERRTILINGSQRSFCFKKAFRIYCSLGMVSIAVSVPIFWLFSNETGRCLTKRERKDSFTKPYYTLFMTFYIVSFIVICYAYGSISKILKKKSTLLKPIRSSRRSDCFTPCDGITTKSSRIPSGRETSSDKEVPENSSAPLSESLENLQKKLTRHRRKIYRNYQRSTHIAVAVSFVFVFSWLPSWVAFIHSTYFGVMKSSVQFIIFMFCAKSYLINSFMNPILYLAMSRQFRLRAKSACCCCQ